MSMSLSELRAVVEETREHVGQPFTGCWQPARDRVIIGVGTTLLQLVPRGPLARCHGVADRPPNPARPFSFQGAARAHLTGALTEVVAPVNDRVVELVFGDWRLHLRLTGRSGGLWLLEGNRVVAAYDGPAPLSLPTLPPATPRLTPPRFDRPANGTWNEAACAWFAAEEARLSLASRRASVRQRLERQLDRTLRLATGIEEDLAKAREAPGLRRSADALAANLHRVRRGTSDIALDDLEEPSIVHAILLDPSVPPSATLERMYVRAGRLERATDRILERTLAVEATAVRLRAALAQVADASPGELAVIEGRLPSDGKHARAASPSCGYVTWTGPSGDRVLVGRNAKENRRLTFQVARGDDMWMHVREKPASHFIIPMNPGKSPPLDLLLVAAQLALVYARIPEGVSAEVQYTRARNIRSIPGDTSGRVLVHDEKVLHVRRDPTLLRGWSHP